ncbi:hypothetical protein [Pseudonocardia xishanensis]|uniref:Uncharacterized protein n=1 Tax=Pseudonocardia xishanensis TaxID=630995 RepID=A0ABP8RC07_9PSEU
MTAVARAAEALRDSTARRNQAIDDAVAVWNDAAFRALQNRILSPLALAESRFGVALQRAEAELSQVERMLAQL